MKDIPLHKGKSYIHDLVAEGEHCRQDFKLTISDPRKIARSISAFANTEGGHLLIGVKDNGCIAGVRNEEDIYVVEQAAERYCVPPQTVEFTAYSAAEGCIVIKATVAKAADMPVCVREEGGVLRAYWRVADENIAAHPIMVRGWRLRTSPTGAHLSATGPDSALLRALAERGPVSTDECMRLVAATQRSVSGALARLFAMGLVEFVHKGSVTYIAATDCSGDFSK